MIHTYLQTHFWTSHHWEYCCSVTLKIARISQDSLFLAYSCCVLNQVFDLLGFWEGGLVNLISIAFPYPPSKLKWHSPGRLDLWHHEGGSVRPLWLNSSPSSPWAPVCLYDPGTRLWQLMLSVTAPMPHTCGHHVAYWISSSWAQIHAGYEETWAQSKHAAKS